MFFIDISIISCIKYDLDEFELNRINVYVWYNVLSMFVNDVVCDWGIVYSEKEIFVWDSLAHALFVYLSIRRYPDSTVRLESFKWRLSCDRSQKRFIWLS